MRRLMLLALAVAAMSAAAIPALVSSPEVAQAQGCASDADCDGAPDSSDQCPTTPGGYNGCPPPSDRDHDGVADTSDACPDAAGSPQNNGCPAAQASATYGVRTFPTESYGPTSANATGSIASPSGTGANFEETFSYRFQYGTTTAYGGLTPLAQATTTDEQPTALVSAHIANLEPATTYHYRIVVVKNSNNESQVGNDVSFTTSGYKYEKPANAETTSGTVGPGGTVRTGTDPSKAHPIEVSVEAEKGGKIYIDEIKGADRPGNDPDAEVNPEDDSPKDKHWFGPAMRIVPPAEAQILTIVFTIDHATDLADHYYRERRLLGVDPVAVHACPPVKRDEPAKLRYRANGDAQLTYRLKCPGAADPMTFHFYNPGWGVLGGESFGSFGSSLDAVRGQGYLPFYLVCVQKCARTVTASINPASAEKLGIDSTLKTVHRDYGEDFNFRVPLSRRVRRALGRAAQITILFHTKAVGPKGQVFKRGFKLRLKRDEDDSDSIG